MAASAMACIDVLFTEEELVNCNMHGANGYKNLDF